MTNPWNSSHNSKFDSLSKHVKQASPPIFKKDCYNNTVSEANKEREEGRPINKEMLKKSQFSYIPSFDSPDIHCLII